MRLLKMSVIKALLNAEVQAVEILKAGGVIALPTDTVYGLACSATEASAIQKLYKLKTRNAQKPVAICVGNPADVKKWTITSHLPKNLIESLLPGPVTLVLQTTKHLDHSLTHDGKIGIRVPDSPFICQIANELQAPVALTSANISGRPSSIRIQEFKEIWDGLDAVFDGGDLGDGDSNRGASTVIDLSESGSYTVIRKGIAHLKTIETLKSFKLCESNHKYD